MFLIDILIFAVVVVISLKKNIGVGFTAIIGILIYSIINNPISEPTLYIPLIILSIITATNSLSAAGGINYISEIIEKALIKHKSFIEIIAPIFTFITTILCGTPYIALAIIPIVTKISIEENLKPVYSITGCIIGANHGYLCSPIGSPFIITSHLINLNRYYMLFSLITSCFVGLLVTVIYNFIRQKLNTNIKKFTTNKNIKYNIEKYDKTKAKRAVFIFLTGLIIMLIYGLNDNIKPNFIKDGHIKKSEATLLIPMFMLSISFFINSFCNININNILKQKTMEYGFKSIITIIGISWITNTLIENNQGELSSIIMGTFNKNIISLGLIMFISSIFMASQTTAILIFLPVYITLGINDISLLKIIPYADGLFFIPLTAIFSFAIECDTTKSTKPGSYILNHSLMIPGLIATITSIITMNYIVEITTK